MAHLGLLDDKDLGDLAVLGLGFALDVVAQFEVPVPLGLFLGVERIAEHPAQVGRGQRGSRARVRGHGSHVARRGLRDVRPEPVGDQER